MWEILLWGSMGSGVTSFALVCANILRTRRDHHAITTPKERKKDQHGFWAELEWVIVAGFEHELGFPHTSESKPHCHRKECWKETQQPTYEWANGFLSIASFPSLSEEEAEFDAFGRRLKSTFGQPLSAAAPIGELNARVKHLEARWVLKHELAKRKAMAGQYIPASITTNEARELGYSAPTMALESLQAQKELNERQSQWYKNAAEKRKNDLVLTFRGDDNLHSKEFESLEAMLKEKLAHGDTMVLPAGYTTTWKNGGELVHIQSPTGMSVWVDIDAYRVKPTLTATDRRRDEFKHEAPCDLTGCASANPNHH